MARRPLMLLASMSVAIFASAPTALGADHVLRPVQTFPGASWAATPLLITPHTLLDDAIAAPEVPTLWTGYAYPLGGGTPTAEFGFAAPAFGADESVTGIRAKVYAATGSTRALTLELRSGTSTLGSVSVPTGHSGAWHTIEAAAPARVLLDDLRLRTVAQGDASFPDARVFAAYAEISTIATAATPGTGTDATPDQPDAELAPESAVALSVKRLTATPSGVLPVPVTCQLATGCTGTVTVRLVGDASPSRRRKAARTKRAKSRFRLRDGQSKTVPVRLDRRIKRVMRKKRRAKIAVTIAVQGAAPVTKQITVVQRRSSGRRR